uniref:divalent-cation tolerance protein CutA n=1 Tax=Thaumasiovibrio occultus TaxID=1891184 RepID=UPI000B353AFE|nr:divalent-cation tolerance protein CutA [Thaumasiovibrio occultus]
MTASSCCVVITTTDSLEVAQTLAAVLLDKGLAACIQRSDVVSSYRWQGKICEDKEYQLQIKTQQAHISGITTVIHDLHNYDLPEVIALPILDGSNSYLEWISAETTK